MCNIKEQLVKRLKDDCDILINVKIPKALENISDEKGVNTYRNLTKALSDNIRLIEEYDWNMMYDECETDKGKHVSVWEQNGRGEIRNHKLLCGYGLTADIINGDINNTKSQFERNVTNLISSYSGDERIIIPTSEALRGFGKTTFLIKQAIKNDGIYVCCSQTQANNANHISKELFGKVVNTIYFKTIKDVCILNGEKFTQDKTLYIDEGVDLSRIDLEKNKYIAFKYEPIKNIK